MAIKPAKKPGECPPADDFGVCVMACVDDFSCSGNKKCVRHDQVRLVD